MMIHQLNLDPTGTTIPDRPLEEALQAGISSDCASGSPNTAPLTDDRLEESNPSSDLDETAQSGVEPSLDLGVDLGVARVLDLALPPASVDDLFELPPFDPDAIDVVATEVVERDVIDLEIAERCLGEPATAASETGNAMVTEPSVWEVVDAIAVTTIPLENTQAWQDDPDLQETLSYFQYGFDHDEEEVTLHGRIPNLVSPGISMGLVGAGVLAATLVSGLTIAETVNKQPLFASGSDKSTGKGQQSPPRPSTPALSTAIAPQMTQPETQAMAPAPLSSGLSQPSLPQSSQASSTEAFSQPAIGQSSHTASGQQMTSASAMTPTMQVPLPPPTIATLPPAPPTFFVTDLQPIAPQLEAAATVQAQTVETAMTATKASATKAPATKAPATNAIAMKTVTPMVNTSKLPLNPAEGEAISSTETPASETGSTTPTAIANPIDRAAPDPWVGYDTTTPSASSQHPATSTEQSPQISTEKPIPSSPIALSNSDLNDPDVNDPALNDLALNDLAPSDLDLSNSSPNNPSPNNLSLSNPDLSNPDRQSLRDFLTASVTGKAQRNAMLLPLTLMAAQEALRWESSADRPFSDSASAFVVQKLDNQAYLQAWHKSMGEAKGEVVGLPAFGFIDYQRQQIILPIETLQVGTSQAEAIASQTPVPTDSQMPELQQP
ncbi:MAG: hypothetical protein VKJ24_11050 [Synechococcales bacterium]|nr:hypothetical protein [Synechococcales bacterium]